MPILTSSIAPGQADGSITVISTEYDGIWPFQLHPSPMPPWICTARMQGDAHPMLKSLQCGFRQVLYVVSLPWRLVSGIALYVATAQSATFAGQQSFGAGCVCLVFCAGNPGHLTN